MTFKNKLVQYLSALGLALLLGAPAVASVN